MNAKSARWGEWQIGLAPGGPLGWKVTVWEWPVGTPLSARKLLGRGVGQSEDAAVAWACALLKQQGAQVFIDGAERPLAPFLKFISAPEDLPCGCS